MVLCDLQCTSVQIVVVLEVVEVVSHLISYIFLYASKLNSGINFCKRFLVIIDV